MRMRGKKMELLLAGAAIAAAPALATAAGAAETITYGYDAQGRLVQVARSGGVTTAYGFDKADNRISQAVTGGSQTGGSTFSILDGNATEGALISWTLQRGGDTSGSATVDFLTAGGSAIVGQDFYGPQGGTLSFGPGQIDMTLTTLTIDDSDVEGEETMTLTLSNATGGATITRAQATGTILDNDSLSFSVSDGLDSVAEGNLLYFTITKQGTTSQTCSVGFQTADGTGPNGAVAGLDYNSASSFLSFAPSQTSVTISIGTLADSIVEGSETMRILLSQPGCGATLARAEGTGTINDP